jgi:hypothetical protein
VAHGSLPLVTAMLACAFIEPTPERRHRAGNTRLQHKDFAQRRLSPYRKNWTAQEEVDRWPDRCPAGGAGSATKWRLAVSNP